MEVRIVKCPKCGANNRIKPHSDGLRPVCGHCRTSLIPCGGYPSGEAVSRGGNGHPAVLLLLVASLGGIIYGILLTPSLLKRDFSALRREEANKTAETRTRQQERLATRRATLEAEVSAVDAAALRVSATEHYDSELAARQSYDKRFALSPREKAQLQMRSLASDSTRSLHDAIRAVAREASPSGADINVRESPHGIALYIDFDMSSMTSGEHGTRTKHRTKESLRKEVISLISRVTNDIFQFCQDLDLASIHIGCRHFVGTRYPGGVTRDENTVLYRIRVEKNRIGELSNNPFLDAYSTTRHFEVDADEFDNIEISTTQI